MKKEEQDKSILLILLFIFFSLGFIAGISDLFSADSWVNQSNAIVPNASWSENVNITGELTVGGQQVCLADGTNCPVSTYQFSAAGWTNTTTVTSTLLEVNVSGNLYLPGNVTASIGGSLLMAGACISGTTTVRGASTGDVVLVTPATYPGDGLQWQGYVSSNDVVTVKVCALLALTPGSTPYNVRVIG